MATAPHGHAVLTDWTLDEWVDQRREEELEQEADRLLNDSLLDFGPGDYPFHPEGAAPARPKDPLADWALLERASAAHDGLPEALLMRVRCALHTARLRPLERRVLNLHVRGMRNTAIARRLGLTMKTVSKYLGRARRRVAAAARRVRLSHRGYSDVHIREVYQQEVNRCRYLPIEHCPPGKEACRSTGLCVMRPYLSKMVCTE